jgi:hypothetical protein
MRDGLFVRLLVILLLAGGMLGAPLVAVPAISAVAQEEEDDDEDEKDDDEDEKDGDEDEKDGDEDKGDPKVSETEAYTVEVDCQFDETANTTTCTFTGIAPDGASDVGHVDLPKEAVCAEVVSGDYDYVDPDRNTRITGYRSRGSEGAFTLVLLGEVIPGGTTTYWFKTEDGVFPGPGPGLDCAAQTPADDTPDGTATATMSTGEIVVMVYSCATVPADTATFDWFGECTPASAPHDFVLELLSEDAGEPTSTQSDASGNARFHELEPGLYSLEMTDARWCHATSDNVNDNGKVIVEEGGRTTVWIFTCESKGGQVGRRLGNGSLLSGMAPVSVPLGDGPRTT